MAEAAASSPRVKAPSAASPWAWGLRVSSVLSVGLLWALVAWWVADPLLPSPVAVFDRVVLEGQTGDLWRHLLVTLGRVAASFAVAMALGAVIGMVMGRYRVFDTFFDSWLVLGLNIPALVVIILCYLWLGLTEVAAITAVAINKIPTVAVTVREGARALDESLLQVAKAFHLSGWRTLTKVVLPQLFPYFMAAARSGLALIWKIVLVVELLGRSSGVGFQLQVYFQFFDITGILAYTLAFTGIIMAVEALVMRPLEQRATAWRL